MKLWIVLIFTEFWQILCQNLLIPQHKFQSEVSFNKPTLASFTASKLYFLFLESIQKCIIFLQLYIPEVSLSYFLSEILSPVSLRNRKVQCALIG